MRRILSLLLLILAALASAGRYELEPNPGADPDNTNEHDISGGRYTTSIPDLYDPWAIGSYYEGPFYVDPYGFFDYGGGAVGRGGSHYTASDVGTADCTGPVKYVFRWHSDTNEPPPAQVVVYKASFCEAFDAGGQYPKACSVDTGLGKGHNPAPTQGNVGISVYGNKWDLVAGAERITISWSPSAHCESKASADLFLCQPGVGVNTYAAIYPSQANSSLTVQVSAKSIQDPSKRVGGLSFNTTKHRHEAGFTVTATVTLTGGLAGGAIQYDWSGEGLEFDDPTAATTTAWATGPGKFNPNCSVIVTKDGDRYGGSAADVCVAIGGPIKTTRRAPASGPTKIYEHDLNNPTNPYYMTYFGYSHDPSLYTPSQTDQKTQGVRLLAPEGQPAGTTITWQLPAGTYYPAASIHAQSIDVDAEGAFQGGVPVAKFDYVGTPGAGTSGLSGTAYDDSADTKVQNGPGENAPWVALVYQFSGHKPNELKDEIYSSTPRSRPDASATAWTDFAEYKYRLTDTFGQPMPGVWVQERFTASVPQGFIVNDWNQFWTTQNLFDPLVAGTNTGDGIFNLTDKLHMYWTVSNPTLFEPVHIYYAGTNNPAIGATTGVPVGTYKMKFIPGQGEPGTATQSKQP